MKHSAVSVLLLLSLICLKMCQCSKNDTELSQEQRDAENVEEFTRKLKNFWTWIKQQASSEDTFVGRCAGAFKKMRMTMQFIIFKLGVIVTALTFLSVLAFKSLAVGVLILIISILGLFSKFSALKQGGSHESSYGGGGAVHLHLYTKGGYSSGPPHDYYDHNHGWYDRLAEEVVAKTPSERMAIADLYKRLGLTKRLYGTTSIERDSFR